MEKKRKRMQVVIAHPIPEERQRVASLLEETGIFHVRHMTCDGLDCLREVVATQPDLLILDTVLEQIDGLEVLRRLKEFPLSKTKCLVLTAYSGYVKEYARFLGADYCLMTPCADGVLAESARMLILPPETAFSDRDIEAVTARVLREMGVPDRLKAYPYTLEGVRILIHDPDLVRRRRVVKELYAVIARDFGVPTIRVERAMRTLTQRLFDKGDPAYLARYFTQSDVGRSHITNTDFLTALTRRVKDDLAAAVERGAAAL